MRLSYPDTFDKVSNLGGEQAVGDAPIPFNQDQTRSSEGELILGRHREEQ